MPLPESGSEADGTNLETQVRDISFRSNPPVINHDLFLVPAHEAATLDLQLVQAAPLKNTGEIE